MVSGGVWGGILASVWRCFGGIFVTYWDVFRGKHEGHIEGKNVLMILFDIIVLEYSLISLCGY